MSKRKKIIGLGVLIWLACVVIVYQLVIPVVGITAERCVFYAHKGIDMGYDIGYNEGFAEGHERGYGQAMCDYGISADPNQSS